MINIKVVGSGCANCQKLADMCQEVVKNNSLEADIEKITDFDTFAELGVYMTPGLLINGKLKSAGKLPTMSTLNHWILDSK